VRVRRRGGRLEVPSLSGAERKRLAPVAEAYVALLRAHVGRTRGELLAAWDDVPCAPTDYKRTKGLRKLLLDRCELDVREDIDPIALRRAVFLRAAQARQSLADGDLFDAAAVARDAAAGLGIALGDVDAALYADLREHHRLRSADVLDGAAELAYYESAQRQAVLLRAQSVSLRVTCQEASGYRRLFHFLKFHRLLYTLERDPQGGYRMQIDGPLSLFQASTRYGLKLALLPGALEGCGEWQLTAHVRWDRDREPYVFELGGGLAARPDAGGDATRTRAALPDEVAKLLERFAERRSGWLADLADRVLELPGIGLCVPDLAFTHRATGLVVYLEVMGYWSRDAVWRRIELVLAGLPDPIVFAVSSRLRVSEAALDDSLPGTLYVYRGVMSAAAITEHLEAIRRRLTPGGDGARDSA
jgi:hypothetical protein